MIWLRLSFLFILFVSSTSFASQIKLNGNMMQGGLLIGWAPPGAKIQLNGNPIIQADEGDFLIGFPYDFGSSAKLEIFFEDKKFYERLLSIRQRKYDVQQINGLPNRKVIPNLKDLNLIKIQTKLINNARSILVMKPHFTAGFVLPLVGRVSGVFGSQRILNGKPRRPHFGLDIAAPVGSVIKSASDGVVTFVHNDMFFNGKTIVIDHGLGLRSTYIHMNSISVRPGMSVTKGQIVGTVGKTGRVTGPHLHWGLKLGQIPLDPEQLFGD